MSANILIVDDEQAIADLVGVYLKNEGYNVFKFYTGRDALTCIETEKIDAAVLDVMLPDMDGFAICQKIREKHIFPVIMLTAKDQEVDKITGLTLGADDYMTKPFQPLELVARIKAQLRRFTTYNTADPASTERVIAVGGLAINLDTHECLLNERRLSLTPTEFSILWILCENR
ncbi:MAG: response regulator transcription factor, partial [Anaerolineaceae bacterium]